MAKDKLAYVCSNCGQESAKWIGRCPSCGEWNTMHEFRVPAKRELEYAAGGGALGSLSHLDMHGKQAPMAIADIPLTDTPRISTLDPELDRVLGGGIVPGSIVLVGGDPGIGKSTLTLQTVMRLSAAGRQVLYVSGEESPQQLKMRAQRLQQSLPPEEANGAEGVQILSETNLGTIKRFIVETMPDLVVVDSIQTIMSDDVESVAGSVSQVRECASRLMHLAKRYGIPIFVIGHITKEGSIAGPKILEHIVDTVLQFEGDKRGLYRILRSIKNRFGRAQELGIYEMLTGGLRPVLNPSELLLSDLGEDAPDMSGVAIAVAMEGMRPLLIETQALVSSAAYGTPQRTATGFDQRRLGMLLAVLEKRVGFKLVQKDVFLNIAGGMRVTDTAIDLSVIAAVLSSNVDTPIPHGWCLCGEVGLSGEVRPVSRIDVRLQEAEKLGFTDIVLPARNVASLQGERTIRLHPVRQVEEALRCLFG